MNWLFGLAGVCVGYTLVLYYKIEKPFKERIRRGKKTKK